MANFSLGYVAKKFFIAWVLVAIICVILFWYLPESVQKWRNMVIPVLTIVFTYISVKNGDNVKDYQYVLRN